MSTVTQTIVKTEELGFSTALRNGVDWSEYMLYRPIYGKSFFRRIYDYHAQKSGASWSKAHDVGAGHGIVSSTLASAFEHVVVSDPNDGYTEVARQLLVEKCEWPESKFSFLQEPAESSSVEARSVDLIIACECIQYTNTTEAVAEFARQLKPGGTLVMTLYVQPSIVNNERAQSIWEKIFDAFWERAVTGSRVLERALGVISSACDSIAIPAEHWEATKRVYINASQWIPSFQIGDKVGEDRAGNNEERVWVHGDPEWEDEQGIDWFKGYVSTWAPRLPESEVQDLWDELERVMDGARVRTETPIVMIFATRRA
ncbi:S-adenosyl-L-methionine-dependent methyltransferase [Xylaria grammica]|nr:S-adenosyl-L-methionine-dependent methyltransferase [Xylaria grammica]